MSSAEQVSYLYSVHVGNLPMGTREVQLKALFEAYGHIGDIFVQPAVTGSTHTFGFVRFVAEDAARSAVQGMNGKTLGERVIIVSFSKMPLYPSSMTGRHTIRMSETQTVKPATRDSWSHSTSLPDVDQPFLGDVMLAFRNSYRNTHDADDEESLKRGWNKLMDDFMSKNNRPCPAFTVPAAEIVLNLQDLDRLCKIDPVEEKEKWRRNQLPGMKKTSSSRDPGSASSAASGELLKGRLPVRVCDPPPPTDTDTDTVSSNRDGQLGVPRDDEPDSWDLHVPKCNDKTNTAVSHHEHGSGTEGGDGLSRVKEAQCTAESVADVEHGGNTTAAMKGVADKTELDLSALYIGRGRGLHSTFFTAQKPGASP